ncbi:MAG: GNAT family N-acetyltransferase [Deltaproteobacteria bacterium]|nr:GNAT family N-acetyltransferase [Deltaproteobacteria bacterium]
MADETSYTLRLMRADELELVVAMWTRGKKRALWWIAVEQAHTPEEDLAFFRDVLCARGEIWLAERAGRVVGLMALQGDHVDQLFIDPDAQGRGAGSALLDHAKRLHAGGVWLFTHQRNERARAFYEARGFRAVAFGVSPPPESEPDVRYEWSPG